MTDPRTPSTPRPDVADPTSELVRVPIPVPGAAGPVSGPTGEVLDGVNQPINLPGERPPLSTDEA